MNGLVASGLTDFLRSAVEPQVQVDAIGIGAIAPPASEPPIWPPAGALPAMPSGKSAGWNAAR